MSGRRRYPTSIDALPFATPLHLGKYTRWVTPGFTLEDVRTLVHIVGEFHVGANAIIGTIFECMSERDRRLHVRAFVALQGLEQMVLGERWGPDGWGARITSGRGFLRISDLPEAARRGLNAAAPGVNWDLDFVLKVPEGFETCGKDASGKYVFALFSQEGVVSYFGQDRQRGAAPDPSVFPQPMQHELEQHRAARWAVGRVLATEHLRRLFWLADEFSCRASAILELLNAQREKLVAVRRSVAALEQMCRIVRGERFDVDELEKRLAN